MAINKKYARSITLFAITWPIFIEMFLQMFMQFADVFMLSNVSDDAVAAIGVVNQIMIFTFVLFNFTAMGAGVVIAQFVGAKKPVDVSATIANAIVTNTLFGLVISGLIVLFRKQLLTLFNLSSELMAYADIYMIVVGGTLFTQALIFTLFSTLQAKGFTKDVMYVSVGMNVLNIIGNYLFIFGALGVPQLGVTGVAIATASCRGLAVIVLFFILYRRLEVKIMWQDYLNLNGKYIKKIMKIGVPSAGEHLSYSTSQIAITVFITLLGATALATKVYTHNLMTLMFVFAMSISRGMQIYVGQLVGAGKNEKAYNELFRGLRWGIFFAMTVSILFALFGEQLLGIFTEEADIITVGSTLLIIGIILEPGRTFNLVIISALRAAGDAQFPVVMGIISMWGISVPLAYFLGIYSGYGLIGIWIAFVIDEWVRALLMFFRWRSRVWERKILVEQIKSHA
jgi:putative MATE family efflux protein